MGMENLYILKKVSILVNGKMIYLMEMEFLTMQMVKSHILK